MSLPDLAERGGDPSETRELAARGRTESDANVSGRAFLIGLGAIAIAIAALALLVR